MVLYLNDSFGLILNSFGVTNKNFSVRCNGWVPQGERVMGAQQFRNLSYDIRDDLDVTSNGFGVIRDSWRRSGLYTIEMGIASMY
jgi:hypothetical protein